MKGLVPLVLGIFGTFGFSWLGLILIPNYQIGHLNPQMDEEATDVYPAPKSGMAERGRRVYIANGCIYCHSQQIRADYAASDIDRKWGERRSAPRDYIFDRPVLLGKERMGPDLSNVGKRAPAEEEKLPVPPNAAVAPPAGAPSQPAPAASPPPSSSPTTAASPTGAPSAVPTPPTANPATGETPTYSVAWHHQHLYAPRSLEATRDSNMPAFRFLYDKRPVGSQPAVDALQLTGSDSPPEGWEIVPTYDAECLVAYLMSLDQSHPLKEVKSAVPAAAASPASPSPAAAPPAPPAPAQPPK